MGYMRSLVIMRDLRRVNHSRRIMLKKPMDLHIAVKLYAVLSYDKRN